MKKAFSHRVLVAMAVSALSAAAHSANHSIITFDQSSQELAADADIKKLRSTLEMSGIKPVVEHNMTALRGMFVAQGDVAETGPDNLLIAATATLRDRDSTNIRAWSGACHTACHGACHGSRSWR